jgi:hypothetical protein
MIQIQSHKPTTAELFPFAYQQDLLKKQSEHFVSNVISDSNIESGFKNMPIDFPSAPAKLPLIVDSKPPQLLIGTYLKRHWRPLLFVLIVGGVATYVYLKSKEGKVKKLAESQIPRTIYYNLPKKSIYFNKN